MFYFYSPMYSSNHSLMNKFILAIVGLSLIYSCSPDSPKTNFSITGKVNDQKEGKLYFIHQGADGNPITDTVDIQNSSFTFKGYLEEPTPYYISSNLLRNNNKPPTLIFLEPTKMNMTLSVDDIENVVLENSESQNEYLEYKKADKVYRDKVDSIYGVAVQNKEDAALQKKLEDEMYDVDSMECDLISEFVAQHRNSTVSAYLISGKFMSRGDFGRARTLFDQLSPDIQSSTIGQQIDEVLSKVSLTEIGAQAPGFTQENLHGQEISLSDYAGKYVLVDFWASWCSPCRQENPIVRQVYNKYKDDNFEIIGISLDKDKSQWQKAIEMDQLTWPQLSDLNGWDNEVSKAYGVRSIPDNILIDPEGRIVAKGLRGEELGDKLKSIFGH